MNGFELIAFFFLIALSGIVVGIFIGFGMGQQHVLAQIDKEARQVYKEYKAKDAIRREDVLESEVIE